MTQSTAAKIYSLLASARPLTTEEIAEAVGIEPYYVLNDLFGLKTLGMVKNDGLNWSRPDVGRVEL